MKIISDEIGNITTYGRIKIDTRIGELEYSYQKNSNGIDDNYQMESSLTDYHDLAPEELEQIHTIITSELTK